ncbi:MAG: hypothetical protein U0800_17540 [Isosphaeraceae bacterium]
MTRDQGLRIEDTRRGVSPMVTALALVGLGAWSGAIPGALAQDLGAEIGAEVARQRAALARMTPAEIFGQADYLVRSGQPEQAVPFLEAFLKAQPDDATIHASARIWRGRSCDSRTARRPAVSPPRWSSGSPRPRSGARPTPIGSAAM